MTKEQRLFLILLLWAVSMCTATAAEPKTWHLLITTYGGKVSLLSGLTKHEAEFSRARLLGLPATPEEQRSADEARKQSSPPCPGKDGKATQKEWAEWQKKASDHNRLHIFKWRHGVGWGGGHAVSDGDVKSVEMFQ